MATTKETEMTTTDLAKDAEAPLIGSVVTIERRLMGSKPSLFTAQILSVEDTNAGRYVTYVATDTDTPGFFRLKRRASNGPDRFGYFIV